MTVGSMTGKTLPHLKDSGCVYLDYNATSVIYPEVSKQMEPYLFECFGNPSSEHVYGQRAKAAVDKARGNVACLIGCRSDEIYFTSCGTESNNWVIHSAIQNHKKNGSGSLPHVVSSKIEHPAIIECLRALSSQGRLTYTLVPVSEEGLVSPAAVEAAITPHTVLVTVMHSNNEVGSIQPIKEIAAVSRRHGVLVHTDAAQSIGKVEVKVDDLQVDLMTVVGHKFGATKGVAALYIRRSVPMSSFLLGGNQERGLRAGTENVMQIAGLGAAAEVYMEEGEQIRQNMKTTRDRLQRGLLERFPLDLVRVNGPVSDDLRLPNTLSISIKGLAASSLLKQLSTRLAASSGAACHSLDGPRGSSSVLSALNVPPRFAVGTLRLSTGRHTTQDEIDRAVEYIVEAAEKQGVLDEYESRSAGLQESSSQEGVVNGYPGGQHQSQEGGWNNSKHDVLGDPGGVSLGEGESRSGTDCDAANVDVNGQGSKVDEAELRRRIHQLAMAPR